MNPNLKIKILAMLRAFPLLIAILQLLAISPANGVTSYQLTCGVGQKFAPPLWNYYPQLYFKFYSVYGTGGTLYNFKPTLFGGKLHGWIELKSQQYFPVALNNTHDIWFEGTPTQPGVYFVEFIHRPGNLQPDTPYNFTVTVPDATGIAALTPATASIPAAGGGSQFTVTATKAWTAVPSASWITITGTSPGVSYTVAANPTQASRTGNIKVGSFTHTITQAAAADPTSIQPSAAGFATQGGTGSITVTSTIAWTAVSNSSWITVTSGASGTGNGSINYQVASNTGNSSRTGTIRVNGNTFTVSQTGTGTMYVWPLNFSYFPPGGDQVVTIDSAAGWRASSDQSWLTVLAASGSSGRTTLTLRATANDFSRPRTAVVSLTNLSNSSITSVTVIQTGGQAGSRLHTIASNLNLNQGLVAADIDADGDLDLVGNRTRIVSEYVTEDLLTFFRNNGNTTFTRIDSSIKSQAHFLHSNGFRDYDNDGDLDYLPPGLYLTQSPTLTRGILRNDGNFNFTAVLINNPDNVFNNGSVYQWGFQNGDGRWDVLQTLLGSKGEPTNTYGYSLSGGGSGGAFGLPVRTGGPVRQLAGVRTRADFDGDGKIDSLFAEFYTGKITYTVGDITETMGVQGPSIFGAYRGTPFVGGDWNNDGRADVITMIPYFDGKQLHKMFYGSGRNSRPPYYFVDAEWDFSWLNTTGNGETPSVVWGDFTGDGSIDFAVLGYRTGGGPSLVLYENTTAKANTRPTAPDGLTGCADGQGLRVWWNEGTDAEAPPGSGAITYNVRIGTTPTGGTILAGESHPVTGKRLIPMEGNAQLLGFGRSRHARLTEGLPNGTYYVKVQTVDANFIGSPWSAPLAVTVSGNEAPEITSSHSPNISVFEGNPFSIAVTAMDPDSGSVTLEPGEDMPDWVVPTDDGNGNFRFTGNAGHLPPLSQPTKFSFTFKVVDEAGAYENGTATIEVKPYNRASTLVLAPDGNATAGQPFETRVVFSDPDFEDRVVRIALSGPAWLAILDNGDGSAILYGTPGISDVRTSTFTLTTWDMENSQISHGALPLVVAPPLPPLEIEVEQPAGSGLVNGVASVDFGNVIHAGSSARAFFVRNIGGADISGLSISIDGSDAADFSVTTHPSAFVATGGQTTFTVTFAPGSTGSTGSKIATMEIGGNSAGARDSFDIALTGEVVFSATAGDDILTLGPAFGALMEDGLGGFDTVVFPPDIRPQDLELTDTSGPDYFIQVGEIGSLQLSNFERLQFADGTIISLETLGEVMTWGTYLDGSQTSPGTGQDSDLPQRASVSVQPEFGAPSLESAIAVDAGGGHALAVSAFGRVFAWGRNNRGQLGIGTTIDKTSPQQVDLGGALAGKRIIAVAAGEDFSLALTDEGKVYGWGSNQKGQLGNGTTADSLVPVAVDASGALSGRTITKIAAGLGHAMALASDGKVLAWGSNTKGQLGIGSAASQVLVPTAVVSTGVLTGKFITAIAAGDFHSLALGDNGHVYAWGFNINGQLGDGSTANRTAPVEVVRTGPLTSQTVSAIAAGGYHSLAATSTGNVVSWGDPIQFGIPGDGGELLPVAVPLAGAHVTKLAAGLFYSVALTADGKVFSWGENYFGQLGIGQSGEDSLPVEVEARGWLAGRPIRHIAAGNRHTIALTDTVYLEPDIEVRRGGSLLLNGGPAMVLPPTVVGQASESTTLGVMNQGRLQLDGFTVRLGGDHPEDFGFDDMLNGLGFRDLAEVAVRFQPLTAGLRRATLKITSNDPNESPFEIDLIGQGTTAQALAQTVISAAGLTGDAALPNATPFNDGVENLLKYAFNMNLAGPDSSTMAAGGTAGLPYISQTGTGAAGVLRFEFIRRSGSGLVYTPKKSTSLGPAGWTSLTDAPTVTPIGTDGLWERVIYEEPSDPTLVPVCFGRVEVVIPPP